MDAEQTPRPTGDLTDEQRAAIEAVEGPVVIHAGAGTGKTTVIAHRTAHAAASGAMDPGKALLLTFTDRAASEMAERVAGLGVPGVTAMTFHRAAWRQFRHFWPQTGAGVPTILSQQWRIVSPLVRRLPGNYRFTPTADVLDALSWAKNARLEPAAIGPAAEDEGRMLPIPADLLTGIWRRYESVKAEEGLIDFDDMILRTTDLLVARPDFAERVHERYTWFSVDEFQDTNPAQFELLRVWLGGRSDLGVVGDEHQTIYSFAGATSRYLREFRRWYPDARSFDLTVNHRSTPEVLELANRLLPDALHLTATRPPGPKPTIVGLDDETAEERRLVETLRRWAGDGVPYREMAVLVRLNADIPPLESALTRAEIPYQVRGTAFFDRRDIREAIRALAQLPGADVAAEFLALLQQRMGFDPDDDPTTPEARERHAALATLRDIVGLTAAAGLPAVVADVERRRAAESEQSGSGVTIATLHRVKGLEWDAVVLPGLEEGHLPVKQAKKAPEQLAEERRLLYVGLTRARRDLLLTWSHERAGRTQRRSSLLSGLVAGDVQLRDDRSPARRGRRSPQDVPPGAADLYERLKDWRLQVARDEQVPAYVVFSNSTLALIAGAEPTALERLAGISGVGPAKLEKYGAAVLAVVAEFVGDTPSE